MSGDKDKLKQVIIDLNYVMTDASFVYPVYSQNGEKLLEEREILTAGKIKQLKELYGSKLYYTVPESDTCIIPDYVCTNAFNQTKEVIDEIIHADKFTREAYKKSEQLIDEILEQLNSKELTVINLLKNVKSFDQYLYYHSINVGMLTALLVKKKRKYPAEDLKNVVLGAYLADLGKIKMNKSMLDKPGKLNDHEMTEMKLHPQLGYNIVKSLDDINPIILQTILFHHERFDDEGYYSLPYDSLPSSPKIVSICDMYDALTSPRPFRQAYTPAEAMKVILNSSDKKFDRDMVSDFLNVLGTMLNNGQHFYRSGDFCILNNREVAMIKDTLNRDVLKPRVIIFARYERDRGKASMKFYNHPIEVDLMIDIHRKLSNIIVHQKLIEAITQKLIEKRMLVDYLYQNRL